MESNLNAAPRRILIIDDAPAIHQDFYKILAPHTNGHNADPEAIAASLSEAEANLFGGAPESMPTRRIFEVTSAMQGQEGYSALQQALAEDRPFAMAFVDMRMPPGWDGVETIRHLWKADPQLQIVICTAYSDYGWDDLVKHFGESERLFVLKKPFDPIAVLQFAHALSKRAALMRELRECLATLDTLAHNAGLLPLARAKELNP